MKNTYLKNLLFAAAAVVALAAVLFGLGVFGGFTVDSADAAPEYVERYRYFYDAAHTQPAGFCSVQCSGALVCFGDVTQYYVYSMGPSCW
ncbi:MAG: hypothetical protein SX243_24550 [Acidobacteriota bacterium]|nr:hypothetical protein [Acidobacteriota bacterium]